MNKAVIFLLCSLVMALMTGSATAGNIRQIRFAETGIIVVETRGAHITTNSAHWNSLDKIRSVDGEMLIFLSSEEVIEFEDGKLSGYFCGEESRPQQPALFSQTRCRAQVTNSRTFITLDGHHNGDFDKPYWLRVHGLDPGKKGEAKASGLPPYTLQAIDGIPVEVNYKDGFYRISERR